MTEREVIEQFAQEKGIGIRDLLERSMHKPWPQLRRELAIRLINAGLSNAGAARAMGLDPSAIVMMVSPRREQKLQRMREYTRRRRAWI